MKIILVSLAIMGSVQFSADAQTTINACGKKQDKVCVASNHGTTSCYKTKYGQSYKVCKNENGYYICCEAPSHSNSTFSWSKTATYENQDQTTSPYLIVRNDVSTMDITAPQNQSYINISAGSR